jgi:hypothetical protein
MGNKNRKLKNYCQYGFYVSGAEGINQDLGVFINFRK